MKTSKLLVFLLAFITLSLTSCKKDEPEPTKTELLTDGDWKYKKTEYYENGNLIETELADGDIKLDFNSDHTGSSYINGSLSDAWTWSFNSDKTQLTLNYSSDNDIFHLEKLTSSKLLLSQSYTNDTSTNKDIAIFER